MMLIARFRSEAGLTAAVRRLTEDDLGPLSIHSPHPVEIAAVSKSSVPLIVLAAGLSVFVASLCLQIYADTVSYPLDIGGRPLNSWPAFIPTAFENGILGAVLAGFLTFIFSMMRGDPGDPIATHVEATLLDSYYVALQPPDEGALERAYEHLREARAEQTIEVPP
jgi:hypothetical protein